MLEYLHGNGRVIQYMLAHMGWPTQAHGEHGVVMLVA